MSGNPAYPNGQCPACGTGLSDDRRCQQSDCSHFGHQLGDSEFPAELLGWHPQDVTYLRDPALRELLGSEKGNHLRHDGTAVGAREDNNMRAGWALLGFNAYSERVHGDSGEEIDSAFADFLADFLHLCDLVGADVDEVFRRAYRDHDADVRGELV